MRNTSIVLGIVGLLLLLAVGAFFLSNDSLTEVQAGELDSLATCLGEKGVTFYGTFWCPHCQNQKKLFGNSEKLLPYIECSTLDGNGQLPLCTEAGITNYPTWEFADSERVTRVLTPEELSEKTGCALPQDRKESAGSPAPLGTSNATGTSDTPQE